MEIFSVEICERCAVSCIESLPKKDLGNFVNTTVGRFFMFLVTAWIKWKHRRVYID
jgi:hypothetical protein